MRTNKKSLATIIITMLMIVCSQLTLQLHSNIAANGSTKIYLIEIVIFVWSIWVVGWRELLQRRIKNLSPLAKMNLLLLFIFAGYYLATMIYHYCQHMPLTSSFYLARIMIEMCCVVLIISYYHVNARDIFTGALLAIFIGTLGQYFTLFFGSGDLRGGTVNMLSNSVTMYTCQILLIPSMIYYSQQSLAKWLRYINYATLLLIWPTLLLTGSRMALPLGLLVLVLSLLLFIHRAKSFWLLLGANGLTLGIAFVLIASVCGPMNKNNLERSVYEPVAIYNKITPDTLHLHMNQLLQINEPHHEMPKNKKKTADNTIRVSNDMRKVINSKAIATITKNNQNLWIGIGMSSVYTHHWGYQKPHNLFLLFLLPFGIIGLIICYLIILMPLIVATTVKKYRNPQHILLILMTLLPVLIVSTSQPTLGVLVINLMLISLTSSIANNEKGL